MLNDGKSGDIVWWLDPNSNRLEKVKITGIDWQATVTSYKLVRLDKDANPYGKEFSDLDEYLTRTPPKETK